MPDNDVETLPEDLEDETTEDEVEDSDELEGQSDDRYAQLEQRLAAIEGQNSKLVNDFTASVGRMQSLMDRLDAGRQGDTVKLQKQLDTAVGAVEHQLDVVLASDTIDPDVRQRAQAVRDKMRAEAELASLRDEVDGLKTRPQTQAPAPLTTDDVLRRAETNTHAMIQNAGLQLEDFNWTEAQAIFATHGETGVYTYFTNKIAEHRAEQVATERRQARKTNAGKTPEATGTASGDIASRLEKSVDGGNLNDGVALLRELGVNPF